MKLWNAIIVQVMSKAHNYYCWLCWPCKF